MKKTLNPLALITASIIGLSLGAPARAETTAPAETPAHTVKTEKAKVSNKALPMHTKADTIDAKAQSFTHTTQKGKKVTEIITASTVIMQGDKPAKFSDIKPGDTVSGTHLKKSDTEYEIVKITKFGPPAPKSEKTVPAKKEAPKKP